MKRKTYFGAAAKALPEATRKKAMTARSKTP
jgi:hypothetical protein